MTHLELKNKVLALIEELNPTNPARTDDPDIALKYNDVANQILYELARIKRLPKYVEMDVQAGDLVTFQEIESAVGYEVFQIGLVSGAKHQQKANGTVYKVLEDGVLEVDCFVYPERITANTKDNFELELSPDVLEIAPYGIAADLLKSDMSAEYGSIYATRYESMLQRLDPRYAMTNITIEGGWSF